MVFFWLYIITCLCLHSPSKCWANTNQRSYDVVSPPHFYVGLLTVDIQYPNVSTINPSWCHSLCDSWSNDPLGCLIRGRTISVDFSREKHCSSKKGVQNGSLACRCGNLSAPASRWTFFAHGPTLRNLLDDLDQKKEVAKESSMKSGLHVSQQCRQQWHMKNSLQPLHLCHVRWQVRCNWSFLPAAWRVILGVRQVIGWCRRLEDLTQQFNNPIGSMYGIYANIGGILMGSMLPYMAAPWILWELLCHHIGINILVTSPWFPMGPPWNFPHLLRPTVCET